jgi:hypothetical protein
VFLVSIPSHLKVHKATVKPYLGSGPYGDQFGTPYDLPCYFEQQRRIVTSQSGDQAVSEGTVYADLTDPTIQTGSEVSVNGYTSTVLAVSTFDDGGITGLAHQEIALQ